MLEQRLAERLQDLTLDTDHPSPLYLQLVERISSAIAEGRWRDGEALPPERILSSHLNVSRTTVRKAIDTLIARGLVTSRRGSGNFVSAHFEQPLARLSGFTEDMRARGREPDFTWLERGIFAADPEEVVALGLETSDRVTRLVRLRLADDEPLAIERASIAARYLPDPYAVGDSLYKTLRERGVEPIRALQHLRAITVSETDAAHLNIASGSAVMFTVRYGYLRDGRPVEFTRSVYRGDRYDFVAEMRRG